MQLDAHKSAVAKAYGLASAGYNKPALKFFSQGAEALVDFAGLSHGQKVLDVATGTGHAALYAGRKVGPDYGSVVGIDIAEEMVHLANSYAKTLSRGNVQFASMDGEHTTFVDNAFDAVLCSYGIFSCQTWPVGSTSGNELQSLAAGYVFRPLGTRHSNRSPICLNIVFVNSARSSLTRNVLLAGKGWLILRHWSHSSTMPA